MPNKNYVAGRSFEYKVRDLYREQGYTVLRTAGSHGPFDLIAVKPGVPVLLIQCKKCAGEKQAFMLVRGFKEHPPLPPDADHRYTQLMEAWASDAKRFVSGGVK